MNNSLENIEASELHVVDVMAQGLHLFRANFKVFLTYCILFTAAIFLVGQLVIPYPSAYFILLGSLGLLSSLVMIYESRDGFYKQSRFPSSFPTLLKLLPQFFVIAILFAFIFITGVVLLAVPALIFFVFYFFTYFVFVDGRSSGVAAFMHSRNLVQGRFMNVMVKLGLVLLVSILLELVVFSLVSREHYVIRYFFDFMISAFNTSCLFILYKNLELTAQAVPEVVLSKKQKLIFVIKYSVIPLLLCALFVYYSLAKPLA